MQIVNLKVGIGETIESVPGAMNFMDPAVKMEVNMNECFGRCMSGSSCVMTTYMNDGSNANAIVGLTPNFPAKIIPLAVSDGVTYRAKDGAYFASFGNVKVGYDLDCFSATCCFGGQGCVRQSVSGNGMAFMAAMGTLMAKARTFPTCPISRLQCRCILSPSRETDMCPYSPPHYLVLLSARLYSTKPLSVLDDYHAPP